MHWQFFRLWRHFNSHVFAWAVGQIVWCLHSTHRTFGSYRRQCPTFFATTELQSISNWQTVKGSNFELVWWCKFSSYLEFYTNIISDTDGHLVVMVTNLEPSLSPEPFSQIDYLWAYNSNLTKNLYALVLICIIQSGHKFEHVHVTRAKL